MALGSTTAGPIEDELFEALGEILQEGAALLHSIHADKARGISAEQLFKIWMISQSDAERTIQQTTQRHPQNLNTTLSHQFGTNDR